MNANSLPRCSPESEGIASSAVLAFVEALQKNIPEVHSLMLVRHGNVVAEGWWSPYGPDRPHMLFSLSKSFTSSAIGLAQAEGRLSIDDPVLSFFPDLAPARVSKNLAAMRVRHLLSMSTGHAQDTTGHIFGHQGQPWAKIFLSLPVRYEPGTHFLYNTGATYMLSAILHRLTGMPLVEYLKPRLFDPLGIENPHWEIDPEGINLGGSGLSIRTEDIARFGQMLLQNGQWRGQQILPEAWVAEATAKHISNGDNPDSDWSQGYGYQFWRCRHGAFRGDGAFGQYCVVMPEQQAVLAVTSGIPEMQGLLDLAWDILLPAMNDTPLVESPGAQADLGQKLGELALLPPDGKSVSPMQEKVAGKRFLLKANPFGLEELLFAFPGDEVVVTARGQRGEERVVCGKGSWLEGTTQLFSNDMKRVAASAVWTSARTLQLTMRLVETPFTNTVTCNFGTGRVTIYPEMNVAFGPRKLARLSGQLIETD